LLTIIFFDFDHMPERDLHLKDIALAILFSLVAAMMGLVGYLQPPSNGEMAVIFPPWTDDNQIVHAIILSGAKIVGPARAAGVFVVVIDNEDQQEKLKQSGALLFAAARGICGPIEQAVLIKE
jgi:hypothetical protein